MPERHVFVVLTNPVEGREQEFNDWYTDRHLADVVAIPGIVSAQRFRLSEGQRMADPPYAYCALYELETDDPAGVMKEVVARSGTDAMPISDAMQKQRMAILYRPMGDPVTKAGTSLTGRSRPRRRSRPARPSAPFPAARRWPKIWDDWPDLICSATPTDVDSSGVPADDAALMPRSAKASSE